ncbi:MAG: glycosyltransferase [Candidatus Moranbacteria bacterium]|nr:glycosyltransferase [Candidatus Moranbacteria bacterium]
MSPKKKIIHIIQSLDNGGCENVLLRTIPTLVDFDHTLVCLRSEGSLAPRFREISIPITCSYYRNFFDIPGLIRLIKIIRREKPDLIITYLFHADVIGRLLLPLFREKNTPIIPFLRTTYNDKRYWVARFFEKYTRFFVKKYFANSEAVKTFYTKNLNVCPERIIVIPNGIDTTIYEKDIVDTVSLQKELSLPDEAFIITCVANLHTNKGHFYLLEAFEKIAQKYPQCILLLVGDGEERKNLEHQVASFSSASRIIFLGKRSDIKEILAISHLFVFPTFFEGLSNALQEAMSMSLPIIATNIPENRILIQDTFNGILIPPRSSESLEKAIRNILDNPGFAQKIAAEARKTIVEFYSLETAKKCFVKAIEQTL